ncbi:hypothetical protein GmHk_15G043885 [Glycine max]|nr:hypothetical protein GmHk_15G043885 [Glycine max]
MYTKSERSTKSAIYVEKYHSECIENVGENVLLAFLEKQARYALPTVYSPPTTNYLDAGLELPSPQYPPRDLLPNPSLPPLAFSSTQAAIPTPHLTPITSAEYNVAALKYSTV